jgi:superfamily II DNA or RNA helicase
MENPILTQTKVTREQIQKEALDALIENDGIGTLNIDTGVGKCKIVIDFMLCKKDISRVLITSPRTNLKENWKDEFKKWLPDWIITSNDHGISLTDPSSGEIMEVYLENVQTAYKWPESNHLKFDLLVGDEVHLFMTPEYSNVFKLKYKYLICLTATTDTKKKQDKHDLYEKYAPVIYTYDTAEEDNIVNKVRIVVINHVLDDNFKVWAGTKKKPFLQGEARAYEYLTKQIKRGQTLMAMQGSKDFFSDAAEWFWHGQGNSEQKEAARIYLSNITKRRSMLLNMESTRVIAGRLAGILYEANKENKILVFSEMTGQADLICKNTVHSNNSADANAKTLEAFNNGKIRVLGSCYSLTLGLNMSGANIAIFESYQSSETLAQQRRGRLHRLVINDEATMYVIKVQDTQIETWFSGFIPKDEISEVIDSKLILSKQWKP